MKPSIGAALESLINTLRTSKHFKVRIQTANALASLPDETSYGGRDALESIIAIIRDVKNALPASDVVPKKEVQHAIALENQVCPSNEVIAHPILPINDSLADRKNPTPSGGTNTSCSMSFGNECTGTGSRT